MKIIDSGTFDVAPDEFISVSIDKSNAPYKATPALSGASWSATPDPHGLSANGGFKSPHSSGARATLTIVFDFIPKADGSFPPGDRYEIVIAGLPSGDRRRQTIFAGGLQSRSYTFRVL